MPERKSSTMDMRAHILTTAKSLFRQKGYCAISVNDIVTAAGVTKPTLYHYFGDKETLFTEVLLEMMRHGGRLMEPTLKSWGSLRETLLLLSVGYLKSCPTSLLSMIYEAKQHLSPENCQQVMAAYHDSLSQPLEGLFRRAILEREISSEYHPAECVAVFLSTLDGLNVLCDSTEMGVDELRKVAGRAVDLLLKGGAA